MSTMEAILFWATVAGVIAFLIWRKKNISGTADGPRMFCPKCGTLAEPAKQVRGSFAIEIILWLTFIVPGLVYSVWRLAGNRNTCPACGSRDLIPPDSPVAARMLRPSGD